MKPNPKAVGEKSEGIIMAAFLKIGKVILIPFGNNQRYDLVIDDGGIFKRVQCKTGRLIRNKSVISFQSFSRAGGKTSNKKDYKGQADLFAVYCPEIDKCYLIPVDSVPTTGVYLRLTPPINSMKKGIRYAAEFEL